MAKLFVGMINRHKVVLNQARPEHSYYYVACVVCKHVEEMDADEFFGENECNECAKRLEKQRMDEIATAYKSLNLTLNWSVKAQ